MRQATQLGGCFWLASVCLTAVCVLPAGASFADEGEAAPERFDAIEEGLQWLAAHQHGSGGWFPASFDRSCRGEAVQAPRRAQGLGKDEHVLGATALALRAFLGAGYTHRGEHKYKDTVGRAIGYLRAAQDVDGCLGNKRSTTWIYGHAIAALALVEVVGYSGSNLVAMTATRAIEFHEWSRNPYFGWRYGVKTGENDTSVSAWMSLAPYAARAVDRGLVEAGRPALFDVPEGLLAGGLNFIERMTDPETGRVGYISRGGGPARAKELAEAFPSEMSEATTAMSCLLRLLSGQQPAEEPALRKGLDRLRALPPVWDVESGRVDSCYWWFGTQAMRRAGGEDWEVWRAALLKALESAQQRDGSHCQVRGSWDAVGAWGHEGGRVVTTALFLNALQVARGGERSPALVRN